MSVTIVNYLCLIRIGIALNKMMLHTQAIDYSKELLYIYYSVCEHEVPLEVLSPQNKF